MSLRDTCCTALLCCALTGLFFLSSSGAEATELGAFLPGNAEVPDWTTCQWPKDANDLYWLIDGAGQVFIDHGFQEAVFQNYYDADFIELNLEIYDQGTSANAESTYHDPALEFGWEVLRDDFGAEGRVDTTVLGSYRAEFWRDRYYTRGTILQKSTYTLQTLTSFCQLVDQKLMGKTIVDGLPENGEIPGWNRYQWAADSLGLRSLLGSEADLFDEWGCSAGLEQIFYNSQFVLLRLELFDQETAGNAQSLYHDSRLETGQEVARDDFGQEGRVDTTSSWTYGAQFWRDRYVARLLVQEKSDSALADVISFCQLVDEKILSTDVPESDPEGLREPRHWQLLPAFPNPFNDQVLVRYRVAPEEAHRNPLDVSIYNIAGQKVRQLVDGTTPSPGTYSVGWDGRDERGIPTASGLYFCRLRCGLHVQTAKLVLLR
jgi:hypothetical protein